MLSDVPAVVAELRAVLDRVAALDPTELADASLHVGLSELFDAETVLRAAQTRWLACADARETTVAIAGRATWSWLIEECQLSSREATTRLRLARTLGQFPDVQAALATARVTAEQATAIVNGLLDVPMQWRGEVERRLIARSDALTPFWLSREVEHILAQLDVDGRAERAEAARQRRLARRGVDLDATFDGAGSLAGTLTPDVHDTIKAALGAAGAFSAAGAEDDRTPRQRRHDALGEICASYLASSGAPLMNSERARVVVTIDAADLLDEGRDRTDKRRGPRLDSGLPVWLDTARRLGCDAQVVPVVLDPNGDVLRLGRTTRVWTAGQRRAAWIRDRGRCVFPACRRPPADLHHIVWWSQGGRTDLDNAAWLCAFHHWLVHEKQWSLRRDPAGGHVFTAPDGRAYADAPDGRAYARASDGRVYAGAPPPVITRAPLTGR